MSNTQYGMDIIYRAVRSTQHMWDDVFADRKGLASRACAVIANNTELIEYEPLSRKVVDVACAQMDIAFQHLIDHGYIVRGR